MAKRVNNKAMANAMDNDGGASLFHLEIKFPQMKPLFLLEKWKGLCKGVPALPLCICSPPSPAPQALSTGRGSEGPYFHVSGSFFLS